MVLGKKWGTRKMNSIFDLTGKVAWVAGGGGYLGTALCEGLAQHGAHVIVADNRAENAETCAAAIKDKGLSAEAMELDIADEATVQSATDNIVEKHGKLDIGVNATHYSTAKPMEQMTMAEWEAGTRVTLAAAFVFGRECGRIMVPQKRGSIIQFSSMYGVVSPDPRIYSEKFPMNPVDYGAAKAGVLQFVRYQASKWGPHGVRVNAVVPGPFPFPSMIENHPDMIKRLSGKTMLERVGRSHEITGAVVYLASDAASYVTGQSIVVDGGWTAW